MSAHKFISPPPLSSSSRGEVDLSRGFTLLKEDILTKKFQGVLTLLMAGCLFVGSLYAGTPRKCVEGKSIRCASLNFLLTSVVPGLTDSSPPELKSVAVHRAAGKIWLDGNVDELAWAKVESLGPFLIYPTHNPDKGEVTEAKMLWDDENLYIAFKTIDKNILATRTQRYEDVFNDDCVEAFLSPFADAPQIYTNIEINALGTFLSEIHLAGPNPEIEKMPRVIASSYTKKPGHYLWSPPGLQIGRQHQGTINNEDDEDGWWIIEMSIPFETFRYLGMKQSPKAGDVWRFNLYRIGGKTEPPRRNLFYLPEPLGNHSPEYYGKLVFAN